MSKYPQGVFELKLCKTKRFPFSKVETHQIHALIEAKHKGIYHKISDMAGVQFNNDKTSFTRKNPFDFFIAKGSAFIVICFYEPRKKKTVYFIDIDRYEQARLNSVYKSLTERDCANLSDFIVELNKAPEIKKMF